MIKNVGTRFPKKLKLFELVPEKVEDEVVPVKLSVSTSMMKPCPMMSKSREISKTISMQRFEQTPKTLKKTLKISKLKSTIISKKKLMKISQNLKSQMKAEKYLQPADSGRESFSPTEYRGSSNKQEEHE